MTGPLIKDKLAARIDGVYNKRDGFLIDALSGRDLADRDRFLIRGQLLFTPTDDISLRLIGDYSRRTRNAAVPPISRRPRTSAATRRAIWCSLPTASRR